MLAHAVLSAFPRFLFFLFLFFFLETSSSAGRWAMGFGKELRKQLRKWLMAADKPDSSTPYSETPKSVVEDTCHHTGTPPTPSRTQTQLDQNRKTFQKRKRKAVFASGNSTDRITEI